MELMLLKAIINGKIIMPDEVLINKVLLFDKGKIIDIADDVLSGADIIDAKGLLVAPGFVDVHIHGSMGYDVMDGREDAIKEIAFGIARYATTSFLPTTMTMSKDDIYQALKVIRELQGEKINGAEILGAHLEGPFINTKYKGAQNEEFIVAPDYQWIDDFSDVIKLITYAPEEDTDLEFTKRVKAKTDITLSIGHSNATYEQVVHSINHGCSHVTHLFNGMPPLHHRDIGIVGAALTTDVFTELIADKVHVSEHLFQFVLNNKTAERIVLITDSIRASCMQDGIYDLGGQIVHVNAKEVRLENGTLAGSVLTLNQAARNFFEKTDATLPEIFKCASLNPATSIGVHDRKGSLAVGKDADIIFLDDDFSPHLTIARGEIVYQL